MSGVTKRRRQISREIGVAHDQEASIHTFESVSATPTTASQPSGNAMNESQSSSDAVGTKNQLAREQLALEAQRLEHEARWRAAELEHNTRRHEAELEIRRRELEIRRHELEIRRHENDTRRFEAETRRCELEMQTRPQKRKFPARTAGTAGDDDSSSNAAADDNVHSTASTATVSSTARVLSLREVLHFNEVTGSGGALVNTLNAADLSLGWALRASGTRKGALVNHAHFS
jgi:hypothetical protein